MSEYPHCVVCGEPAAAFDGLRDAWVCETHILGVSKPEREAVEKMERADRSATVHYLIGKRTD